MELLKTGKQKYYSASCYSGSGDEYYDKVVANLYNIIDAVTKEFSDDDFYITFVAPKTCPTDVLVDNILVYLEQYIDAHHPKYMDDLLSNANDFIDDEMYNLSAYCIRLYAETCLSSACEGHVDFGKNKTLGKRFEMLKSYFGTNYESNMSNIQRINHIVHNDMEAKLNPPTSKEMHVYAKWVITFEKELDSIIFVHSGAGVE